MDLGLPLRPGCDETHQVPLRVKEEECGHMITWQDGEEKPIADLHCKTESDCTESLSSTHNDTPQTVEVKVKKEEDEQKHNDCPLESAEHSDGIQQKLHGQNDELNQQLNGGPYHCTVCRESFTVLRDLEEHQQTHTLSAYNQRLNPGNSGRDHLWSIGNMDLGQPLSSGCDETHQVHLRLIVKEEDIKEEEYGHMITCQDSVEVKVEKEEDEQQHNDCLLESASDGTQQNLHGQNNQQLNGGPYHCTVCRKSFTVLRELEEHQETHTLSVNQKQNTGEKLHKCAHCGKAFTRSSDLQMHILIHTGKKLHKCTECGKEFSHVSKLQRHMRKHTGEKPHECAQCGKAFASLNHLNTHMLIHTGEKPHECAQCGKAFARLNNLIRHMLIHTGEKPHECVQCRKAFSCVSGLKTHMLIHTGEKPHKCSQCGKAFRDSSNLKEHMVVHTGEKPHKCAQCGKAFTSVSRLKKHILIHTGEKPHVCAQCGKAFTSDSHLKTHILIHTGEKPHVCAQCGKAFALLNHLNRHMLIHTGEKPHVCAQCGKAFARLNHLNRHILIHTGEKPLKCAQCGKAYTRSSSLKCHQRLHSEEKAT